MERIRTQDRSGNFFLVAVLVANFTCGILLLLWLRADLTRDLIDDERTLVSSRVNSYLWGKIVLFASSVGADGRLMPAGRGFPSEVGPVTVVRELPPDESFERVRSGTGGLLPLFLGRPREEAGRGTVLPLAAHAAGFPGLERYVVGSVSLADLSGYFTDLKARGILCRLVDSGGNHLFGDKEAFTAPGGSWVLGTAPILAGGIGNGWSAQVFIMSSGPHLPILPQAILALFFLSNAATLVFLRKWFIRPPLDALDRISRALSEQGELLPRQAPPRQISDAVTGRFVRFRKEIEEERIALEEKFARQVHDLGQAHKDLVAHHKVTKKMLQSRQIDEVFETLLDGIAEGYGFRGALLGKVSRDGFVVFAGEPDPLSGVPTRIPLWNPNSLLARTFWSGTSAFLPTPLGTPHLPEEEAILGERGGASYVVPVTRNLKSRCADIKNCGDRNCINFYSENLKCWLRRIPPGSFIPDADPEQFRVPLEGCLQCEVFPSAALLVLRTVQNGKGITRETVVPVSTLASEATLALEVVSLYDNMKLMAITDGLTGLFNHREFYNALRRELERARRYKHNMSLLMIDVDDFKQFNDLFGHPAGDIALRKIADLIRGCARTTDIIARYGGEEFALILPESQPVGALMVAERIKTEIANHNFIPSASKPVHLTVSVGVFSSEDGGVSEDQMVSLADEAAYTAKQQGKNRVVVKATA